LRRRKSPRRACAKYVYVGQGRNILVNHIPAAARAVQSALPWILVAGALKGLTQNQDSRSVQVAAVILCLSSRTASLSPG